LYEEKKGEIEGVKRELVRKAKEGEGEGEEKVEAREERL